MFETAACSTLLRLDTLVITRFQQLEITSLYVCIRCSGSSFVAQSSNCFFLMDYQGQFASFSFFCYLFFLFLLSKELLPEQIS